VVIGGLATSTLITLVFVPTLYTIFEEGLRGARKSPVPAGNEIAS
jgi:Cu/Ag efflux pump CusA